MIDKKVWRPVIVSDLTTEERRSIIPSSIFLKEKYKPSGEFDKVKARLVPEVIVMISSFIKRLSQQDKMISTFITTS
jgi:hypothetical protein